MTRGHHAGSGPNRSGDGSFLPPLPLRGCFIPRHGPRLAFGGFGSKAREAGNIFHINLLPIWPDGRLGEPRHRDVDQHVAALFRPLRARPAAPALPDPAGALKQQFPLFNLKPFILYELKI